jgi:hypothetical protein
MSGRPTDLYLMKVINQDFYTIGQIKGASLKIRGSRPNKDNKNSDIKSGDLSEVNSIYSSEFVQEVQ